MRETAQFGRTLAELGIRSIAARSRMRKDMLSVRGDASSGAWSRAETGGYCLIRRPSLVLSGQVSLRSTTPRLALPTLIFRSRASLPPPGVWIGPKLSVSEHRRSRQDSAIHRWPPGSTGWSVAGPLRAQVYVH